MFAAVLPFHRIPSGFRVPIWIVALGLLLASGVVGMASPGLPADFDRSTPRATIRHFLDAIDAKRFEFAAAALHLPIKPPGEPAALARMLGTVIERRLWLTANDLPDRADGVSLARLAEDGATPDQIGSIAIGSLEFGRFPITIRLNRYCDTGSSCAWQFAPDVVEATPALYDLYGPGWLERLMPQRMLDRGPLGLRLWEWAALPVLLGLAVLAGRTVSAALARMQTGVRAPLRAALAVASTPAALLSAALVLQYGIGGLVAFSAPVSITLQPILVALIVASLVVLALRVMDAVMERLTERYVGPGEHRADPERRQRFTSIYAMRRILTLIGFAVGVGLFLYEFNVFTSIGVSLLTSAGVATVILGVAAQTVLGNILASLQIAIAKPIRIGDAVAYEGEWSYVEAIYYTYVRLRTWDERRLVVPVQYFISHPFENWSVIEGKMTRTFWLTLDHQADTQAVRERFEALAREDADALHDEMTKMLVLGHNAEGVRCRFYITAANPSVAWNLHARIQEKVITWIRETHPDWWPRERVQDAQQGKTGASVDA